jgi:hypothetical protein
MIDVGLMEECSSTVILKLMEFDWHFDCTMRMHDW